LIAVGTPNSGGRPSRPPGPGQGGFRRDGGERSEPGVQAFDPRQVMADKLDRAELSLANRGGLLKSTQIMHISHITSIGVLNGRY
jgi:hypothetical protein